VLGQYTGQVVWHCGGRIGQYAEDDEESEGNVTGVVTGVVTLSDLPVGFRAPRAVKKNCTEGCKRDFVTSTV
jgi:hypothetical protein